MSQVFVEQLLGRIITDAEFRDRFFRGDDLEFYRSAGVLTEAERAALADCRNSLCASAIADIGVLIAPTIRRADLRPKQKCRLCDIRLESESHNSIGQTNATTNPTPSGEIKHRRHKDGD